jgi:hypothetical protein
LTGFYRSVSLPAMLARLLSIAEQARRDLRMVWRGLSGRGPSPVVRSKPMLVRREGGGT